MFDLDQISRGLRGHVFLGLLVTLLALPGVLTMPVMDRDEARFTQASAQMLETGDYVVIRFHDGLRNKKPVGIHWLQTASVAALSSPEAREIWAYRIPSLLGAILAACAALWGGAKLMPRRAAFIGAMLLGSTLLLTSEAHIAKTDAALCGFITLSMAALAHLRAGGGKATALLFWVAVGAGTLIKGPVAPMVAGLAGALLIVWERRWDWIKPLLFWPGPILAAAMVIPWFIAVQIATDGLFLNEAVSVDLGPKLVSGAEGHAAPPGTHLAVLPLMMWPATLFLLPGLFAALQGVVSGEQDARRPWRFLIAWALPTWLVFELMPTKLVHYTLPAYPALALMAGAAVHKMLEQKTEGLAFGVSKWPSLILFALGGLALTAVASPWGLAALRADAAADFADAASRIDTIWSDDWRAKGVGAWPSIAIFAVTLTTVLVCAFGRLRQTLLALLACALITGVSYRSLLLPNQGWTLATEAALEALTEVCALPDGAARDKTDCTGEAPALVRAIAFAEPSFVFSVAGKTVLPPKSTPTPGAALPPIADEPHSAWVINAEKPEGAAAIAQIVEEAADAGRCVRIARRYALNYSNGDASTLTALAVAPGPCADAL